MNATETETTGYVIVDGQTQKIVGKAKTLRRAHAIADKKDLEYGAIRYVVKRAQA